MISLESKGLSRVFSSTTVRKHRFLAVSFLYSPAFTSVRDDWKNHSLDQMELCWQSNVSLLFNTLCRFVIAFLPRSKRLLISLLQSLTKPQIFTFCVSVLFLQSCQTLWHPMFCPLDSPGKNTGVGCHALLHHLAHKGPYSQS